MPYGVFPCGMIEYSHRMDRKGNFTNMKKRIISVIALALVLLTLGAIFCGVASAASSGKQLQVTRDTYLNSKKSTSAKTRIMKVAKGTIVTQISTGSYYKVSVGGKEGYIKKSYLTSSWGYGKIGSIEIANTKIDYNVAIAPDNDYYINHNSKGSKSAAGAIYADFRALDEDRRSNLIIYGHNMKNGTMFADLHKYEDADFFAKNPTVKLTLDGSMGFDKGNYTYTVFAQGVFPTEGTLNPWRTQFANTSEFRSHVKAIWQYCKDNGYNVSATAPTANNILTLSTCVYPRSTTERYLVFAYRN